MNTTAYSYLCHLTSNHSNNDYQKLWAVGRGGTKELVARCSSAQAEFDAVVCGCGNGGKTWASLHQGLQMARPTQESHSKIVITQTIVFSSYFSPTIIHQTSDIGKIMIRRNEGRLKPCCPSIIMRRFNLVPCISAARFVNVANFGDRSLNCAVWWFDYAP